MTRATTEHPEYTELAKALREAATLASVAGTLSWDQETMMPPAAAPFRAEQLAAVSALAHERAAAPRIGELLAVCEADRELTANPVIADALREVRRDYDRAVKLPTSLVREMAETTSRALEAWKGAREASDFSAFAPWLERVVRLNRARAECYGAGTPTEMYDVLMDEYEPGMTAAEVEPLFASLRDGLTPLIREITSSGNRPDDSLHRIRLPIAAQVEFNRRVAERIGFDLSAGRLDTSTHPFCQGIGPGDTRLTTRYREDGFPEALSSTLHEAGHGLYEQGLPKDEHFGLPLADSTSLGIHESQSRMWENFVGRSRAFWEWALPEAKAAFGAPLEGIDVEQAYRAMNLVEPSLVRVESDEATYNLHIMLRFDLERALLTGNLPVDELPSAWNERVRQDLGLDVPDDRRGVLQDIHWAMGAIGYFPTYTLGNLYAAQLWRTLSGEVPGLESGFRRGEFAPLLDWLREKVHAPGRRFTAPELCRRVTGEALDHRPLLEYLEGKLRAVYRI